MGRPAIPRAVRRLVRDRSGNRCEYCLHPASYASGPFVCEHVLPRARGAGNTPMELAWACSGCNSHKYDKTQARDPATGQSVPLFNPRSHLAVADVPQAAPLQGLAAPVALWHVERLVRLFAAGDSRGPRQAQRLKRRNLELQLGQVRSLIFPVPARHQPLLHHVPVRLGGCTVEPHQGGGQIVAAQGLAVEHVFKVAPPHRVTQIIEGLRQTVVGHIGRDSRPAQPCLHRQQAGGSPRAQMTHPGSALGQAEGQPDRHQVPETQAPPVPVGGDTIP